MKKLYALFIALFALTCITGCKTFSKQPAEPAQFESAAKSAGFSVSDLDPKTVNAIQDAESAQIATKDNCNVYYAIYNTHYFDSSAVKMTVNGKEVKNDPSAHSREQFVNSLLNNRNSNRNSQMSLGGSVFIKSASNGSYYFYAGSISNTFLYFDGDNNCRSAVDKIVDALNY